MTFPTDIKHCIRDCVLSIFWARKDIVGFFEDNGCTKDDLKGLGDPKGQGLGRAQIIDALFQRLSERPDGGLGQFRAILQSLLQWSHFDPYYFDTLGKLDRATAHRNLDHLRQLQEIRDAKIKKDRARIEREEAGRKSTASTLVTIRDRFLSLFGKALTPQRRGYALEHVLQELAKLSELETTEPFRVNGEQIDGAVKYDGEHYLIEAKWHDEAASNEPLYQFAAKVEGKMYGRGLFISINGFSPNAVKTLVMGKAIRTILVDGGDLTTVVEGLLTFSQLMDRKVKAAQTKGLIFVDPVTGLNKAAT